MLSDLTPITLPLSLFPKDTGFLTMRGPERIFLQTILWPRTRQNRGPKRPVRISTRRLKSSNTHSVPREKPLDRPGLPKGCVKHLDSNGLQQRRWNKDPSGFHHKWIMMRWMHGHRIPPIWVLLKYRRLGIRIMGCGERTTGVEWLGQGRGKRRGGVRRRERAKGREGRGITTKVGCCPWTQNREGVSGGSPGGGGGANSHGANGLWRYRVYHLVIPLYGN